ncbi:zonular occludens toxin domain-containing protein [Vibrio parahaemolyticus]|uniref:zonular occludens toxin domain-containing protein n=1 Tax=Vibrio parahaemolyticus TaxID=670 RepID=UPI0025711344|nr:zonular occludens toxin domain-containing protein [Vibrio parahaemolyticus]WJE02886.1 zonular occludens toxin domain-containing protein [Vibrio parahaemolyticus]
MAINIVLGVPGGGKSYYTCYKYVLPTLKEGRKIITNLPLNVPYLTEILGIDKSLIEVRMGASGSPYDAFTTAEDFKDSWRNEKNQAPLVIIDEAHFCLPKNKKAKEVQGIREFFSTHRQEGYDVVLITQTKKAIPRDILDLCEYRYTLQKKQVFKIFGLFGNKYKVTIFDQNDNEVGSKIESYKKDVFKCYNSHLLSKGEIRETDASTGVSSIWLKPQLLLAYAFIAFFIYKFTLGGLDMDLSELQSSNALKKPAPELKSNDIEMVQYTGDEVFNVVETVGSAAVETVGSASVEEKLEPQKPVYEYLNSYHPLENKIFQIRSWIADTAFITLYDKDTKEKVSVVKSVDLEKMGYVVENYSECSMSLTYSDISFFIDCSEVKIEDKKIGSESFVSKFAEN